MRLCLFLFLSFALCGEQSLQPLFCIARVQPSAVQKLRRGSQCMSSEIDILRGNNFAAFDQYVLTPPRVGKNIIMGAQGSRSRKSGRFPRPASEVHSNPSLKRLDNGSRWIISARKTRYKEAFGLQLRLAAEAAEVAPGLWETRLLTRDAIESLASVRGEVLPLVRTHCRTILEFVAAISALNLKAENWTLHHERLQVSS